ncbi:coagulation factor IX-like [Lytechinus variegatus]|uniref:coagulation factor IX-like n=1 Tax=Lytechinus variegatus TaxID=7654 RepID=UPI001BB1C891|nr:coagulation factor IX-like [Lytechinus variegatus]
MAAEWQANHTQCGRVNKLGTSFRILGGEPAPENAWPWQVAMFQKGVFICGGSLIDPLWVLTAAHCIEPTNLCTPGVYSLRVGSVNITGTNDVTQEQNVQRIIVHPNYDYRDNKNHDNDLALLKVEVPFTIRDDYKVNTVCLPTINMTNLTKDMDDWVTIGDNVTITGWGKRKNDVFGHSDTLYEAIVPIYNWTKCTQSTKLNTRGFVTENMICAGYDDGKADSCQGDSGGPMVYLSDHKYNDSADQYFQIGVVSWGYKCGKREAPGVYTRLTRYEDWIRSFVTTPTQISYVPCACDMHTQALSQLSINIISAVSSLLGVSIILNIACLVYAAVTRMKRNRGRGTGGT